VTDTQLNLPRGTRTEDNRVMAEKEQHETRSKCSDKGWTEMRLCMKT